MTRWEQLNMILVPDPTDTTGVKWIPAEDYPEDEIAYPGDDDADNPDIIWFDSAN